MGGVLSCPAELGPNLAVGVLRARGSLLAEKEWGPGGHAHGRGPVGARSPYMQLV